MSPPRLPSHRRALLIGRLASGLNLSVGVWLLFAPLLLGYTDQMTALSNDLSVGAAIAALAAVRFARPRYTQAVGWLNVALGAWLVASPYALRYSSVHPATLNELIAGGLIVVLALLSISTTRRVRQRATTASRQG